MGLETKRPKELWDEFIHPQISPYLPVDTIVHIEPGNGDISVYLNNICRWIGGLGDYEAMKKRLPRGKYTHTFEDIKDKSVDMFFAWGLTDWSIGDLQNVIEGAHPPLVKGGLLVIHHSNWLQSRAPKNPYARNETVAASKVSAFAEGVGFRTESQEPFDWGQPYKTDCLTILKK